MKKKILLLLIITFGILLIPKNGFAKTLEINLPSNQVSVSQRNGMFQYYSFREMLVLEFLTDYFCHDGTILYSGRDGGQGSIFPYYNFGLEKEKNSAPSLGVKPGGSVDSNTCTLRNLDNGKEIINYVLGDDYIKFQLLSNVSDDDLFFSITDDMRSRFSSNFASLLYGYDSIRFTIGQMEFVETNDLVYDFTKYNDLFDMTPYNSEIFKMIFDYFSHMGEDPNFPIVIPENYGNERLYDDFYDRNGKQLFRFYSTETNNSNIRAKIVLGDGVSYKDNFTYVLPNDLKSFLASQGYYVNSISCRFGDEPKDEPIVDKVKKIVSNPKTYNGMFIVLILLICSIGGFGLYKKINS